MPRQLLLALLTIAAVRCPAQGGKPRKPLRFDAAVEAILVPSDDPRHAALNPAVQEPRIVIRNDGTEPLMGISIRYGTLGFKPRLFAWTGRLGQGASTEVVLPHTIDMLPGQNTFVVRLGDPNGRKDRDPLDNELRAVFTAADHWGSPLTVRLRIAAGSGGWLRLESTRGAVLLNRAWRAGRDTVMRETLHLPSASYLLQLGDSGQAGAASVRLFNGAGDLVKALRSEPRKGALYPFRVESSATPAAPPLSDAHLVQLPGRGQALVDAYWHTRAQLVVASEDGATVLELPVPEQREAELPIDLGGLPAGAYTVRIVEPGREAVVGRMVLR